MMDMYLDPARVHPELEFLVLHSVLHQRIVCECHRSSKQRTRINSDAGNATYLYPQYTGVNLFIYHSALCGTCVVALAGRAGNTWRVIYAAESPAHHLNAFRGLFALLQEQLRNSMDGYLDGILQCQ